jgi:capsular polysaccharide biosynthesis protein
MPQESYVDDEIEIDLRGIVQKLWKARIAIIMVTVLVAAIAFVVSFWFLPRKYQATAYLFIGQPVLGIQQDSGVTISPTLPDIKAVVKLATAPEILSETIHDPAVVSATGKGAISISDLADMVVAIDVGKDQLSLQINDVDPLRAVLLANTLAKKVADTVNATYGLGAIAETLDTQVLQSKKDYEQAQFQLEDALSKSQIEGLSAQRDRKTADLADILNSISRTTRGLDDLQFFEKGLSGLAGDTPLSLGDGLALTTLRQRSLTTGSDTFSVNVDNNGSNNSSFATGDSTSTSQQGSQSTTGTDTFTLQIDSATFAGFTVSKALDTTTQMRAALQAQLSQLQTQQKLLEQEIPQLQRNAENARAQLNQLQTKRDQSSQLYDSLLLQQQRINTVLAQSAKVASVSIQAVRPDKESSPKVLLNTVAAGLAGLMLIILWVFLQDWWINSGDASSKKA